MKAAKAVCEELKIPYYRLDYLIRNRLVPAPQRLSSGQRVYTDEDVRRIREKLFEISVR